MTPETISYPIQSKSVPLKGQVTLAEQTDDLLVVYQAYHKSIADFAAANQKLDGS